VIFGTVGPLYKASEQSDLKREDAMFTVAVGFWSQWHG